jgi:hypothetical protein
MSNFKARFFDKIENYILLGVTAVAGPLILAGFYSHMDERHEPSGSVSGAVIEQTKLLKSSELNSIRREKRGLENYERLAPNTTYSAARQAEIEYLKDEEKVLEQEIMELNKK